MLYFSFSRADLLHGNCLLTRFNFSIKIFLTKKTFWFWILLCYLLNMSPFCIGSIFRCCFVVSSLCSLVFSCSVIRGISIIPPVYQGAYGSQFCRNLMSWLFSIGILMSWFFSLGIPTSWLFVLWKNALGSRCRGLIASVSQCHGALVRQSRCRGFLDLQSWWCRSFLVLRSQCCGICVSTTSFSFSL